MQKIDVEVMECSSGVSKKGNAYNVALVRIPAKDGRVGKIFSDVALPVGTVSVEFELAPNSEMFLSPRIRKVSTKS